MDLQASKLALVNLIVNTNSEELIAKIIQTVKHNSEDFWIELSPEEKAEINLGISQLNAGERISLEDFLKKVS